MGLFDKKFCDICGDKIGLLGNRKLADGNLCKECASKLSPFFSERKQSTVEEIKAQLAYREDNKTAVEQFQVSKVFGKSYFILIDEAAGNFMANHRKDYRNDNPDVISMSAILGIDVETNEDRRELTHEDKDGHNVSYTPPRYEYSYDVTMTISVNHPYFSEISFKTGDDIIVNGMGREIPDPARSVQYREAMELADKIKEALTSCSAAQAAAAEPPKAVKCPHCGATTYPDKNGCCEYCGSAL